MVPKGGKLQYTCINPGTMVNTPIGKEEGDIDFDIAHNGTDLTMSVAGSWHGADPGFLVWPPDIATIGSASNRFKSLGMTQHPCPASVPGKPAYCYATPDGFFPVYK